jgi:hypothetical protein
VARKGWGAAGWSGPCWGSRSFSRRSAWRRGFSFEGSGGAIGDLLLLEHWKLLTKPLLYLSLFFKRLREESYRRLNAVRIDGDWEGWLDFFLDGVATIADEAVDSASAPSSARWRIGYRSP